MDNNTQATPQKSGQAAGTVPKTAPFPSHELVGKAFFGVYRLGHFVEPNNRRSLDGNGLEQLKDGLNTLNQECVFSLSGLGELIQAADPDRLTKEGLYGVGLAIANLAKLMDETISHLQSVETALGRLKGGE